MVDCRVYFHDALGVEHSAEVRARSLYEAVCRGWAAFMFAGGWDLFEASWKAQEFIVVADSKTYRVDRDKFLEWLSKDRDSPARKNYLRRVLDGLADWPAARQHSAMKHPRQTRRAPQTHPSALAVPSYHRILVKHGLIEKNLSISDAYEVFLKVGADPEVEKLRRKVERGNKMKQVPALHLATAMALQGMTKQELEALKLRIEENRV